MSELFVSIVQEDCTSCGLCAVIEPNIFYMHNDSLAYVKPEGSSTPRSPELTGLAGQAIVSLTKLDAVIEAATECPGDCIMLLPDCVE